MNSSSLNNRLYWALQLLEDSWNQPSQTVDMESVREDKKVFLLTTIN